jgi:polysaccharide pyruvyl transferase WcaK-like protein
MNVLILAGDTDGNIGDRAIVLSTCLELRRHDPDVRITIVSGRPDADRVFFGADVVPRGARGLAELAAAARRSDLVLCGGGGLFHDDASLVKMPYWALRLAFVRALAPRIIGYSLGVGPLNWSVSRLAARIAFACMDEVSVRDEFALAVAQPLTSKRVQLVPDPALMLPSAEEAVADRILAAAGVPEGASPLVGVAVRRWFHHQPTLIPHKYAVKYRLRRIPGGESCEQMTSLLARVLDRVSEEHGARVLFLPTYGVSHEADDRICEEVGRKMRTSPPSVARIDDPRAYKALAGRLSVLLGSRMHATILAATMGTPVVGLSYNRKFEGFFRLIGREDQVITIEDFVAGERTQTLANLLADAIREERPAVSSRLETLAETTQSFTARILFGRAPAPRAEPAAAACAPADSAREIAP